MSMTLKRVELWNIRSHKHFRFEPDETGITSVSGTNGAGKSTIVDSFAWALYGTKPNNIKNKMLIREGVSPKTDTIKAEVEIEVNKMSYLITRAIISEGGASECNIYGRVTADEEYSHLAGPAISSAEAFIRQVLKMDEKGFLTAVFIQQKQVDQIVAASPRERGEVIEKLTGIQSITNAINLAREEARAGQKAASLITTQDVDSIKTEIEEGIKDGKALKAKTERDREQLISLQDEIRVEELDYTEQYKKTERMEELKRRIEIKKNTKGILQRDLDEQVELVANFKQDTGSVIAPNLDELLTKSRDKNRELMSVENLLKDTKGKITSKGQQLSRVASMNLPTTLELEDVVEKLISKKTSIQGRIDELKEEKGRLKGQLVQIQKSLDTLGETTGECPVCKTHIDNPEELKEELDSEIKGIKERQKEINKEGKNSLHDLESIELSILESNKNLDVLKKADEVSKELVALNDSVPKLDSDRVTLLAEAKVLNDLYSRELEISARANEINRAKENVKRLNEQLKEVKDEIDVIEKEMSSFSAISMRELNGKLRNKIDSKKKQYNDFLVEHNKDLSQLDFARKIVMEKKRQYEDAKAANDKYTALVSSMKTANVTGGVMTEFKSNRLKYAIPALEMYASTILSKFTENKFIKLSLDEKFNTFVTTEAGTVRPISQLSGGELSAAAIALRIGVSMLLNDGDNNVLILDEILVSMDEVRARHIIETITSITNCQIIFIAHNTDIKSIADKTVLVQ